jgi:hypothetical protein
MLPGMIDTVDDDAFRAVYGDHFIDCMAPQFSERDLAQILFPETMLKLGNWVAAGYVTPKYEKDPRGGKDRRRYSISDIVRIAIIDSLVNGAWMPPRQAVEIADFAMTFQGDAFDRHPDNVRKSEAEVYVISHRDRSTGRMKSNAVYRKPDEGAWYEDDPFLNPDATPGAPPAGIGVFVPVTDCFKSVFMNCAKFLVNNKRGGLMDKYRRPIDVE